jgi:hypothetical protein
MATDRFVASEGAGSRLDTNPCQANDRASPSTPRPLSPHERSSTARLSKHNNYVAKPYALVPTKVAGTADLAGRPGSAVAHPLRTTPAQFASGILRNSESDRPSYARNFRNRTWRNALASQPPSRRAAPTQPSRAKPAIRLAIAAPRRGRWEHVRPAEARPRTPPSHQGRVCGSEGRWGFRPGL